MECVKGSDLAMNGSDDLERARSRDIVANALRLAPSAFSCPTFPIPAPSNRANLVEGLKNE